MKVPYVRLETKTLVLKDREVDITNKLFFNRALNEALKEQKAAKKESSNSFLVVGKEFSYRMRFLKSGTAVNPRWTSEKKIEKTNVKYYLSVGDPLTISNLLDFYARYKVELEAANLEIKKRGRPKLPAELRKPRKKYPKPPSLSLKKRGRPKSEKTLAKERWIKWHEDSGVPIAPRKRGRPLKKTLWYTCELPPNYVKS